MGASELQAGASGSTTACHEDFGDGEVPKGCSRLRVQSLFSVLLTFVESAAEGTDCVKSSKGLLFCPSFRSC